MREYETTLIIQPEISEEGSKAILERLDGILEKHGDIRLMCEDMGKRKLAYEIRKFHKGHYHMLTYLGEGKAVPELERTMRLDESVLRFMTIQVSEDVEDIEARKTQAQEIERLQAQRAAEKASREAEDEKARQEAELAAAAEQAALAEAASESGEGDEERDTPGLEGADLSETPAEDEPKGASDPVEPESEISSETDGDKPE